MSEQRAVIFDIETVPDLEAGRLALGLNKSVPDAEVRRLLGERYAKEGQSSDEAFVKPPLHKIVCLGALYAERTDRSAPWSVTRFGVAHIGVRTESQIVSGFIESLASPAPQLIGFNSSGFDLPVLRYRAFALSLPAHILHKGNGKDYWYRFGKDHVDLCDLMSGFGASAKPSLMELAALCGIRGKIDGMDGASVEPFVNAGRIEEVAAYCEVDVAVTYLLFLRFALVTGETDRRNYDLSMDRFRQFVESRTEKKPHLASLLDALPAGRGAATTSE